MPILPPLSDPCGNPIPMPFDAKDFTAPALSLPDALKLLAALLGITTPMPELATPCPILKDRARAAAGG